MNVLRIFISPEHNYFGHHGQPAGTAPDIELAEADLVAGMGIRGDRFYGWKKDHNGKDYRGQVTFFSKEMHDALCHRFGLTGREPSAYRRNIIVEGIDLNSLIGQTFWHQGIRFEGVCECSPCHWMDQALHPGTEDALKGNGGLRARVLTSGPLRAQRPGPGAIILPPTDPPPPAT